MLADLAAFVSKLEGAIDETMQTTVAEGARKALEEAGAARLADTPEQLEAVILGGGPCR